MQVRATRSSPRSFMARASPAACGICVATGEEVLTTFMARSPQWLGIWRAPELGSPFLPIRPRANSRGVNPRDRSSARSR